jgi:hypothetical protein
VVDTASDGPSTWRKQGSVAVVVSVAGVGGVRGRLAAAVCDARFVDGTRGDKPDPLGLWLGCILGRVGLQSRCACVLSSCLAWSRCGAPRVLLYARAILRMLLLVQGTLQDASRQLAFCC